MRYRFEPCSVGVQRSNTFRCCCLFSSFFFLSFLAVVVVVCLFVALVVADAFLFSFCSSFCLFIVVVYKSLWRTAN